jgi:hypothetical protein
MAISLAPVDLKGFLMDTIVIYIAMVHVHIHKERIMLQTKALLKGSNNFEGFQIHTKMECVTKLR